MNAICSTIALHWFTGCRPVWVGEKGPLLHYGGGCWGAVKPGTARLGPIICGSGKFLVLHVTETYKIWAIAAAKQQHKYI